MSYTNPSAYSETYLQAYYDFSNQSAYKDIPSQSVSVYNSLPPSLDEDGNYIKLADSSYNSSKGIINNFQENNSTIELIQEYGINVELAAINTGLFIGNDSNITGHFSQNYSSLGSNFENCALYIQNSRNFTHGESTFIFSYTKTTKKPEILFSSINKYNNLGFEIGVNNANKLYIEWTEDYGPQVITLNTVNYNKNIYVIDIDIVNNKLVLSRWDGFEERLIRKAVYFEGCECFKANELDWIIGSGTYRGDVGINYVDEPYKCESYIDKFLYFNGQLSDDSKVDFIRSLYETIDYLPRQYENYSRGIIGYNKVIDHTVSGIIGYEDVITGYKNYVKNYTKTISSELIGDVSAGETYYEFDDEYVDNLNVGGHNLTTGIFLQKEATESLQNVITGFSELEVQNYQTSWSDVGMSAEPMYYHSGVSGKLYDVYKQEPIYSEEGEFLKEKGQYIMSGVFPLMHIDGAQGYGSTKYTYLGARNKRTDYVEHYQGVNPFTISNFADVEIFNKFNPSVAISYVSDLEYNFKNIALYVNGISQNWGELDFVDDDCNLTQDKWNLISGNFGIYDWPEGTVDAGINKIYYNDENFSMLVDHPLIDVVNGDPSTGTWATFDDYIGWDAPYSNNIEATDKIFFNGQKLVSGQSYWIDSQDNFRLTDPETFFQGASGYFYSEKNFHKDEDNTYHAQIKGDAEYDIAQTSTFIPGSCASYLNGIRLDPKAHVYHSDVDLINQNYSFIMETESFTLYNDSITYMDQHPTEMELYEIPEFGTNWALSAVLDEDGNIVDDSYGEKKTLERVDQRRNYKIRRKLFGGAKEIADLKFY